MFLVRRYQESTVKRRSWKTTRRTATDILHSLVVRERDGHRCQWLGCTRREPEWQLEAAHIISRRFRQTRHLTENAITLCYLHHRYASEHQTEWEAFCRQKIGDANYLLLEATAKGPARRKPDEKMVRTLLREERKRLEARVAV